MTTTNKKRLLLNLLLLAVITALVLFISFRDVDTSNQYQTLYDKAIGDDAKEIIIRSEGRDDVVLENTKGVWNVLKPSQFVADSAKVRHLFTLLSENAESNYPLKGKNLAEYGLDKERLSVSFNGVKFIFGHLNAVTQKRFIRKEDTLYLISETVSGLMEMGEESFKPDSKNMPTAEMKPVEKR